ncbi:DegS sensor signal transduction histidine kinase [Ruminiclostridium papyrosolvens DSM 2782]|uniref:Oxygen sensor histidine kinase NreB n=1 Tax=Ruminiclostridium papyrosolvens DSM 2782 TaxID=588581 RepID=F1TAT9_9FIRM|nr:sensor histidine kinase [Ruminiclostridium papyrosolvens]EGD48632.1 DegS sensor signal transduction histidine kinase [Ruminiclostridium papyrosolvens DSM 2782]WES32611.1 sensor histidine kinase [Ruminiclostridium papyrosolvens DSM 2782]
MRSYKNNSVQMNDIITKTIKSIESGKNEIIEIAENSRKECKRLEDELVTLKQQVFEIVSVIENLEHDLKLSKKKLYDVNKEFNRHSQNELAKAYQTADNIRVELAVRREQETFLIRRRNDLEIRIKECLKTLERADSLIGHVSIALDYLSGDLQNAGEQLDNLQQRQFLGIKIIEAQEEERKRVAREIHDGPAQSMSNIVIKAEICERLMDKDVNEARKELQNLKKVMREGLQEVRKIIYNLRPMALDDLGLLPTLERYVISFKEETGIDVQLRSRAINEEIKPVISLAAFRIVQESLNNVLKHAQAKRVSILLEHVNQKLIIIIADNGVGFNTKNVKTIEPESTGGFGLFSMKERVTLLEGEVDIVSQVGVGTKITIHIPLLDEGEDSQK